MDGSENLQIKLAHHWIKASNYHAGTPPTLVLPWGGPPLIFVPCCKSLNSSPLARFFLLLPPSLPLLRKSLHAGPMSKLLPCPSLRPKVAAQPTGRIDPAFGCGLRALWAGNCSYQAPGVRSRMINLGSRRHVPLAPCIPHLEERGGTGGRHRGTERTEPEQRSRGPHLWAPLPLFLSAFTTRPSGQPTASQRPDHGDRSHSSICLLPARLRSPQTWLPASAGPEKYGVLGPPTQLPHGLSQSIRACPWLDRRGYILLFFFFF